MADAELHPESIELRDDLLQDTKSDDLLNQGEESRATCGSGSILIVTDCALAL